jgi:molybdopterin biosynthesis enzyme MoaB
LLIARNIIFCIDGSHGTLRNADSTVNALIRINDKKIGSFAEAINWANINTVGVFAADAGFSNNVSHDSLVSRTPKQGC